MQKKIIIRNSRELVITDLDGNSTDIVLGVKGEKNATKLIFERPNEINGEPIDNFTLRAVFTNAKGSHVVDVIDNEIVLNTNLTSEAELSLSVQFLKNSEIKWVSFTRDFIFFPANDDGGKNIIDDTYSIASRPFNIVVNYLTEKFKEKEEQL